MPKHAIELTIQKPLWDKRKVGIAQFRLRSNAVMNMTIAYKDKDGNRLYPYTYLMDTDKIMEYPTMTIQNGIVLYVVPIKDFKIMEI